MSASSQSVFIDTNILIHAADLKDLPWRDLYPTCDEIIILISPTVIHELDKHKTSDRRRLRDRSRAALKAIDAASQSDEGLTLRSGSFKIRLCVPHLRRPDWERFEDLDPMNPDHRIVAEILSFGPTASFVAWDSGPRLAARRAGVNVHEPPDNWLLRDEATREDRELRRARADLKSALESHLALEAGFGKEENTTETLEWIRPKLPPLPEALCGELATKYLNENPRHKIHVPQNPYGIGIEQITGDYTSGQKRDYNRSYNEFSGLVRDLMANLEKVVAALSIQCPVPFYVANTSSQTATKLQVQLSIEGDAVFVDTDDHPSHLVMPSPPKKPERKSIHELSRIASNIDLIKTFAPQDNPTAFYWTEPPQNTEAPCVLTCEDFRATEQHNTQIWTSLNPKSNADNKVHLKVSASNLRQPVLASAELNLVDASGQWTDPNVLERLPDWMGQMILSHFSGQKDG